MKRNLPQQLTSYLNEHGVLASKGISVEQYEIKYAFLNVVRQVDDSGDYGVWVCIFLYRLSHKQPLAFKDPIQTVLAYRETMLQYFWNHKFAAPKFVLMDKGFGVPLDTLDPTILKISYPVSGQGNWYVFVLTMSSETWNQVANNRLPRESIRFKRSSQAVVGGLIYWLGHERGHSVQVYNPESDSFNNVTQILGNAGSFYVGVKKLTIKVEENAVHVSSSSSSKPLDIDLNESMSPDQDMVCPNTPHKFIPQYRFNDKETGIIMSAPYYIYPIIVPSDSDVEDAFSSINTPDYTSASPDYSPASPRNTSSDPSEDLSKDLLASLAISPFHDDPYMKIM
ncbi:hypothetical protein Tco_1006584 [Tanacetum coccineum]|uniref:Ubiquitin-like protease family profile domain-containing protein n=1 Tax=Tanacetum coccineum TaxID=301880 RepID=A0ABQ5FI32_9ASTR